MTQAGYRIHHSAGCVRVLISCDFPEVYYRAIEEVVYWCAPDKVVGIVQQKDPAGDHIDFDWFVQPISSIFGGQSHGEDGFAHDLVSAPGFWEMYDYLAQWVDEDFSHRDLELIAEMAGDLGGIRECAGRSKPNIRYLYKVWKGSRKPPRETNSVDVDLSARGVETHG